MKHLILLIALFCVATAISGCTKTLYTPQQNMDRYKTKRAIVDNFGLPTEKRTGEGIEEWIYNYGTAGVATEQRDPNATVNGSLNKVSVTQYSQYDRYLKFTFDSNGNFTRWESQGVDLSVKEKAKGRTIAAVAIALVVTVAAAVAGTR